VVFDVEAVFLFPWAIQVEALGMFGVVAMLIFMLTLVEGLFYAVKKGVLQWD
jgi:NADH-quinone oxidoreductase subunit A